MIHQKSIWVFLHNAQNIICKDKLAVFDSLSIHRKYANLMNVDDVPEEEKKQTAREVADTILSNLKEGISFSPSELPGSECSGPRVVAAVVPDQGSMNRNS